MSLFFMMREKWAREREGYIRAGIISDPNEKPDFATINLIERNHKCAKCSGDVNYVQKPDGGVRDYHFVCKECGHEDDDAPLKRDTK